jgi:putative ABC transport system permease protein
MHGASGFDDLSYDEYRDLQVETSAFSPVVAEYRMSGVLVLSGGRELLATSLVTTDYLDVLGVRPRAGRLFEPRDDQPLDAVPVVISADLQRRRFADVPDVLGTTVLLNDRAAIIVGVLEEGFRGQNIFSPIDVWLPLNAWLAVDADTRRTLQPRDARALAVFGVLRPGVSEPQARADLDRIAMRFADAHPEATAGRVFVSWRAREDDRRKRVGVTLVVLCLGGFVLLVACTNVSTILLARAEGRRRETAVRLALGASGWQLFRLLVAEALLLSVCAGALGLLLAHWLLGLGAALKPATPLPIVFDFGVDPRVVLYTLLLVVATTVVCALAPLWQSTPSNLAGVLRGDAAGSGRTPRARFAALVVAQIAVTQVLLCGAALLLRSHQNTISIRPGYGTDNNVLMVTLAAPAGAEGEASRGSRYFELAERIAALPGVRDASFIDNPLLSGFGHVILRIPRDDQPPGSSMMRVSASKVGFGYFELLGTRIIHGRDFERQDQDPAAVAVVNEQLVRRLFPQLSRTSDALGLTLRTETRTYQIVGVVEDGKYGSLREAPQPHAFLLAPETSREGMTLLVATHAPPAQLAAAVRDVVHAAEPQLWIAGTTSLAAHTRVARILDELGARVTAALGSLALVLAAIGLYGLGGFWVQQRMRECGIRMAMGATPRDIVMLLQRQAMRPVIVGIGLGLAGTLLLGPLLSSLLYGVMPYDPVVLGSSLLFTLLVSLAATWIPARRCRRAAIASVLIRQV